MHGITGMESFPVIVKVMHGNSDFSESDSSSSSCSITSSVSCNGRSSILSGDENMSKRGKIEPREGVSISKQARSTSRGGMTPRIILRGGGISTRVDKKISNGDRSMPRGAVVTPRDGRSIFRGGRIGPIADRNISNRGGIEQRGSRNTSREAGISSRVDKSIWRGRRDIPRGRWDQPKGRM